MNSWRALSVRRSSCVYRAAATPWRQTLTRHLPGPAPGRHRRGASPTSSPHGGLLRLLTATSTAKRSAARRLSCANQHRGLAKITTLSAARPGAASGRCRTDDGAAPRRRRLNLPGGLGASSAQLPDLPLCRWRQPRRGGRARSGAATPPGMLDRADGSAPAHLVRESSDSRAVRVRRGLRWGYCDGSSGFGPRQVQDDQEFRSSRAAEAEGRIHAGARCSGGAGARRGLGRCRARLLGFHQQRLGVVRARAVARYRHVRLD